jgi:pyruvate,water dikinase
MDLRKFKKNLTQGSLTDFKHDKQILWFDEIGIEDIPKVGGKNASLGEMYQNLTSQGVKIPFGFATTSKAYEYFIDHNNLKEKIYDILHTLNTSNLPQLAKKGKQVRDLILASSFPGFLKIQIEKSYEMLEKKYGKNCSVAIRSSATAEDLPDASFAGQQETYLNVHNKEQVILNCKKCYASLFTNRAISYRVDKNFSHFDVALSIGVQKMVRSDKSSSGVMFSIDTESGFKDVVYLTSIYGLGENIVQGAVNPDEFLIFKPTLEEGYKSIISKKVGSKNIKMVYDENGCKLTKNIPVSKKDQEKFSINDKEIIQLSKWAVIIEKHYSKKHKKHTPMDMEWAKDGISGELFIVQARPETVVANKNLNVLENYVLNDKPKTKPCVIGASVGERIGKGKIRIIHDIKDINTFVKGDILVTDMTDPDWEPIMKIASAIITNRGGRTCHAAIISRELEVPCLVGTKNGTDILKNKEIVTVDCSQGEEGFVYREDLKFQIKKTNIENLQDTKTKLMLNLANPNLAFSTSFLPNSGVGLARMEFIINSTIRLHPNALIHYDYFKSKATLKEIEEINELTKGYKNKLDYYVDKLTYGMATIGAAFYPKKVIFRFSDFKSNEYSELLGGKYFEPTEDNPMIGFRGASRYYSKQFESAFKLECLAVKKVREELGLYNVEVMIPFCRSIEELKKVLKIMKSCGIERGRKDLRVILMCEVPSNVILAEEFLEYVDGYSIGSNDLTQLTLGVDRDSELLKEVYNERNPAVLSMISKVIKICNQKKKYIGICGQAPSDYPEMAEFIVKEKIGSMSLNPDSLIKTKIAISKLEKKLFKQNLGKKINVKL